MSSERLDHLKNILKPLITKQWTNLQDAILTGEKLSLTLRFLASGESEQSLSFAYRLEKSTVSNIKETYYGKLTPIYLTTPSSEENWLKITRGSKHIRTQCPADTGAKFHNHKRFFSLVLLTASDARCCFTLTDIEKYGSNNYSDVLKISELSNLNLKQLFYLNQELLIWLLLRPTAIFFGWRWNFLPKNMADKAISRDFARRTTCLQRQTV